MDVVTRIRDTYNYIFMRLMVPDWLGQFFNATSRAHEALSSVEVVGRSKTCEACKTKLLKSQYDEIF
jgi:hypothetical protein